MKIGCSGLSNTSAPEKKLRYRKIFVLRSTKEAFLQDEVSVILSACAGKVVRLKAGRNDGAPGTFDVEVTDGKYVGVFVTASIGFKLVGGDVRLAKIPGGNRCEKEFLADGIVDGDEEYIMVGLPNFVFVGEKVRSSYGCEFGLPEGLSVDSELGLV